LKKHSLSSPKFEISAPGALSGIYGGQFNKDSEKGVISLSGYVGLHVDISRPRLELQITKTVQKIYTN